jgi:hypothetical protein
MLNKNKELNNMTKQEKNKTLQILNEISVLLDEAAEKYINELPPVARIKYADVFSHIGRAEDGLINVAYELLHKESA